MPATREKIINQALSWLGCNEADGSHRKIIDVYNSHAPLARGHKMSYSDDWCAAFVTACAIKCGATDIIPKECSCNKMIELFKKLGSWEENDAHVPSPGDIVFYDWDDKGSGDNASAADHVGIVEKVEGTTITVIDGNNSNGQRVKRRTLTINGKYIRGYGVPKYEAEKAEADTLYYVQLGPFAKEKSAEDVLEKVISAGFSDAFITTLTGTRVEKPENQINVGDTVTMQSSATVFGTSIPFSPWVYSAVLYVRRIDGEKVLVSTKKSGAITGSVDKKYLIKKE